MFKLVSLSSISGGWHWFPVYHDGIEHPFKINIHS